MAKVLSKYTKDNAMDRGTAGQGIGSAAPQAGVMQAPTQAPTQNASGNFTNLSSFLNANKQAGERIGSRIGEGIKGSLAGSQAETQKQVGKLGSDLSTASTNLSRGEGYQQELGKENFNAQEFLKGTVPGTNLVAGQQPEAAAAQSVGVQPANTKLQDFSSFRTGTAVNQQALKDQKESALNATTTAQQQVGQKQKAIGSESGRFGLLKDYLGNTNYRQGLQSLDQTFLQQQGQKQTQNIQKDLQQRQQNLFGTQNNIETEQTAKVSDAVKRANELASGLTTKTKELETNYVKDLQDSVADVNTERESERQRNREFYRQLYNLPSQQTPENIKAKSDTLLKEIMKDPKNAGRALADLEKEATSRATSPTPLDQALLQEAGLNLGEQTFNVFKNPTSYEELFNEDAKNASTAQQIASQQNVDYYDALSQLMGQDAAQKQIKEVGEFIDPTTGQIRDAASIKQGEGSIRNKLDNAKYNFLKDAIGANLRGYGIDEYNRMGKNYSNEAYANANIAALLAGGDTETYKRMLEGSASAAFGADLGGKIANFSGSGGVTGSLVDPNSDLGKALSLSGQISSLPFAGVSAAINNIASGFDDNSGNSRSIAQRKADSSLRSAINSYLSGAGFQNYLGETGVKQGGLNLSDYGYGKQGVAPSTVKLGAEAPTAKQSGVFKDYLKQNFLQPIKNEDV